MAHYKPYKMKGHTLPGINQKSEPTNMPDGKSKSSPFQQNENDNDDIQARSDTVMAHLKSYPSYYSTETGDENRAKIDESVENLDGYVPSKTEAARNIQYIDSKGNMTNKKQDSPNKWVQFIPMALSAISSMKKDKK